MHLFIRSVMFHAKSLSFISAYIQQLDVSVLSLCSGMYVLEQLPDRVMHIG